MLALFRHDGEYFIQVDGVELMSTRRVHSERAIAELACAPFRDVAGARVLVGGLGFGFTLEAALALLRPDAQVVVAEIVAEVIAWNLNPEYDLAREALGDARVELRHADVADVLRASGADDARFDAIILDVDNGADALTNAGNARLYRDDGIRMAVAALRPGGRLAYWSANDDPAFATALRRAGLSVEIRRVRAHATTGPRHVIFLADRAR